MTRRNCMRSGTLFSIVFICAWVITAGTAFAAEDWDLAQSKDQITVGASVDLAHPEFEYDTPIALATLVQHHGTTPSQISLVAVAGRPMGGWWGDQLGVTEMFLELTGVASGER